VVQGLSFHDDEVDPRGGFGTSNGQTNIKVSATLNSYYRDFPGALENSYPKNATDRASLMKIKGVCLELASFVGF